MTCSLILESFLIFLLLASSHVVVTFLVDSNIVRCSLTSRSDLKISRNDVRLNRQ